MKAMRDVFIRSDWRKLARKRFVIQNVRGSKIKEGEEEEEP